MSRLAAAAIQGEQASVDRRRARRYSTTERRTVQLADGLCSNRPRAAVVRDLCVRGLGLVADFPFVEGEIVSVRIDAAHGILPAALSAQVRHVRAQPDGNWLLGCSLSRSLTDDEMFALL